MLTKVVENVRIAMNALGNNKLRSALTMLGITIGVWAVILLMSVGQAVEAFVINEFSSFGSNLVVVFGAASTEVFNQLGAEDEEIFAPLTQDEADALANPLNVPDAIVVASALAISEPVTRDGERYDPQIAGITPSYFQAYEFEVAIGRNITEADDASAARVAVIGQDVVEEIFDNSYPVGERIRIGEVTFSVVGVFEEISSAVDPTANNTIVIPLSTAQRRLAGEQTVDASYPITSVSIKARNSDVVDDLIEQVRETMRVERDLEPDDDDDFVVFSQNELLDTLETITTLLTAFLATIAGISLLVGGIGIMNIMLVTVTERTKEIGLRKAVGAQRIDILVQFLVESVTLALLGGAIGTFFAVLGAVLATALVPDLSVEVRASSVMLATAISIAIGTFFGAYPANRAARLNPIDALRYE